VRFPLTPTLSPAVAIFSMFPSIAGAREQDIPRLTDVCDARTTVNVDTQATAVDRSPRSNRYPAAGLMVASVPSRPLRPQAVP